jgi:ribosomal protein L11 methyltransferase
VDKSELLEVSLLVDGELAEAVAEVLARFIPNGVVIESTQVTANEDDEGGHAIGPLRVCGYLPSDTQVEALRGKIEEALWYLSRIAPMPAPQFRLIQEVNWVEAWKEHYHPIPIGKRLIIIPAWLETPPGERLAVRIDPGMAFGTGTHPTTQLCLAVAEKHLQPGANVIDIGCGSGILSIAALKLGAAHALAVDIDPLAMQASRQNAELNGVMDQIELGVGSVREVLAGDYSLRRAPLMFANILAPVIINLFEQGLADLVESGGLGILSGILDSQADAVLAAAEARGFSVLERMQNGDWVAFGIVRSI